MIAKSKNIMSRKLNLNFKVRFTDTSRKYACARILLILLGSFFIQNKLVNAQTEAGNFEFNESSTNGWTLSGAFDPSGAGPFPSNFSPLIWTDSVNSSNSNIFDDPNNGQGAISFSVFNDQGFVSIQGIEGNTWVMNLRSPDLSNSPLWFTAQGFDILIAQNMNADTNLWVDLSIEVLDKNTNRILKVTKPGRHRIVPGFWNNIRFFEWYNLEGFPQKYSILRIVIDVIGEIDAVNRGSVYIDDLILIPGRNVNIEFPKEIVSETYEMLSFPVNIFGDFNDVFTDDYGPLSPQNWRIFRWDELINNYHEFPANAISAEPGVGFWFIQRSGRGFDIDYAQSVSTSKPYMITLERGWNQIGNPFPFPISWENVISNTPIGINSINKWNSDTEEYEPGQSVLEPWVGYFIDNPISEPVFLEFLPIENTSGGEPFLSNIDLSQGEFIIQLKLEDTKTRRSDTQNYVGMIRQAEQGFDQFDFRDVPSPIDRMKLTIVHNEENYSGNFIPVSDDGAYWDLKISSSTSNEIGNLTFENLEQLPSEFNVWLLDVNNKKSIRITEGIAAITGTTNSNYRLIVGTKIFAENNNEEINLEPRDYYLLQNFPNPFNPTTTIKYSIADDSNVKLIIYDLIGKEISTLINDEQKSAGAYSIIWDGKNNFGNEVSSGLYFYRLITEKFVQTNKMLLLK
jgi:hypothetical protein